ncbi:hypothetical protein EXIGLDRAFT_833676, partial [Exidia glandulosa HHB12029]
GRVHVHEGALWQGGGREGARRTRLRLHVHLRALRQQACAADRAACRSHDPYDVHRVPRHLCPHRFLRCVRHLQPARLGTVRAHSHTRHRVPPQRRDVHDPRPPQHPSRLPRARLQAFRLPRALHHLEHTSAVPGRHPGPRADSGDRPARRAHGHRRAPVRCQRHHSPLCRSLVLHGFRLLSLCIASCSLSSHCLPRTSVSLALVSCPRTVPIASLAS